MTLELINNELVNTDIRILKEVTCPSLSERSSLTYHIGCNEHNDILFRIHKNSGTGKFNREWVPSGDMLELIYESKKPFSWKVLHPLTKGRSLNTPCFLLAILKNENLIIPLDRLYEQRSSAEFQDRMAKLMKSEKAVKKVSTKPKKKVSKATSPKKGKAS